MSQPEQQRKTAVVWDPKNPAALLLPSTNRSTFPPHHGDENNEEKVTAMQIHRIFSHTGVGCNEHEISALIQLLDAHEHHMNLKPSLRLAWDNIKNLSKSYRAALRECLCRWEDNLMELEESVVTENSEENAKDGAASSSQKQQQQGDLSVENLELLKLVYAITHLSEIFLLPPPTETTTLTYYDNIFVVPGAMTADTVRYLRHHHCVNALQQVDPDILQEIVDSRHPDLVDGGKPYFALMTTLVKHGNLEQAWALLSRHSLFRRATGASENQGDESMEEYEAMSLEQDKVGFWDFRGILLSAPIPGGRDDVDDVGLDDAVAGESMNPPEILLEGLRPDDYLLWETSRPTAEGTDFPTSFTPVAASQKRNAWHQYILEMESIKRLRRRIPQLEPIIAILSGNLKSIQFESWAEALLAELIYTNPIILPGNIQVRAEYLMSKYPQVHGEMDGVLLSIMQGNAGGVIEVLHAFGGGSGAALPATMTSLLCNLYMEANHELPEMLQTDLLKAAAFSISSSLAGRNSDVGIRLVVRLLLPYAKPDADASIVATLGETLERHLPGSDVESRNLVSLCQPLIEKKSVRVLEGCVNIVLCRYRSYLEDRRPGGALHWLLVGIDLESYLCFDENGDIKNWQSIEAVSVCYRHLVTWCTSVAGAFLRGMREESDGFGFLYETAKAMIESVKEGPLEAYATKLPEVRTLELLLGIYDGMTNKHDWTAAARNITLCLAEEANEHDDGVVACLAPRSMHWDLLQLGHQILQADEKREADARLGEFSPSFDVKGVQTLMEKLHIIILSRDVEGLKPLPAELVQKIRLSLGHGLKRAFVAENARRKPDRLRGVDDVLISRIRSVDLHKHSISTQEQVVRRMLDI